MNGGPSQTDTFDMKPGHEHGGPFKPISSRVPGISLYEHFQAMSHWTHRLAIVRSMSTREPAATNRGVGISGERVARGNDSI
jgi:hypothetical protein